jgi:hypothetical protein
MTISILSKAALVATLALGALVVPAVAASADSSSQPGLHARSYDTGRAINIGNGVVGTDDGGRVIIIGSGVVGTDGTGRTIIIGGGVARTADTGRSIIVGSGG